MEVKEMDLYNAMEQDIIQELIDELKKEQSAYLKFIIFHTVLIMIICVYIIFG